MRLPAELRQLIVEEIVADNATVTPDCCNHDLWSLASTSTEWYSVAQPKLFGQLEFLFDDTRLYQWEKLKNMIDGRPSLLEHVRGLVITIEEGAGRIFCRPPYDQDGPIVRGPSINEMRRFKAVFPSTLETVLALPFEQLVLRSVKSRPYVAWNIMEDFMHDFLIKVRSKTTLKSLQIEKIHGMDLPFILGAPERNLNDIKLHSSTIRHHTRIPDEEATSTTERILNFLSNIRSVDDETSTLYSLVSISLSADQDILPQVRCCNLSKLRANIMNRPQAQIISQMMSSASKILDDLDIGHDYHAPDQNLPYKQLKNIRRLSLSAWVLGPVAGPAGLQIVVNSLADIGSIPTLETLSLTVRWKVEEDCSFSTWCKTSPFPNMGTILSDTLSGVGRDSHMETQLSRLRKVSINLTVNYMSTAVEIASDPVKWVEQAEAHLSASFAGLSSRVDVVFDVRLERTEDDVEDDIENDM